MQGDAAGAAMTWFFWDDVSGALREVHWTRLEHHPDSVSRNGVHIRRRGNRVSLWVLAETKAAAAAKMERTVQESM